ncbi:unnamed protein product [Chrysoparadoxa australica]
MRRYMPIVADMKCVLNIEGVPQRFLSTCFYDWVRVLALVEGMDPQTRKVHTHVTYESREWMHAFNVNISLSSIFGFLVQWIAEDGSECLTANTLPPQPVTSTAPILARVEGATPGHAGSTPALVHGSPPALSPEELFRMVFKLVIMWSRVHGSNSSPERSYSRQALPMFPGGCLEMSPPRSSRSFHHVNHRFFAALVKSMAKSARLMPALWELNNWASESSNAIADLVDVSVGVLEFASEVRCGLWRRNGESMNDQVLNYSEPPFCRMFRDLDLMALQFGALSYGPQGTVNHVLHRYGCFYWFLEQVLDSKEADALSQQHNHLQAQPGAAPGVPPSHVLQRPASSQVEAEGEQAENAVVAEAEAASVVASEAVPLGIFSDPNFHLAGDVTAAATARDGDGDGDDGAGARGVDNAGMEQRARDYTTRQAQRLHGRGGRRTSLSQADFEQQRAMAEDCLLTYILMLTEMPLPPDELVEMEVPGHGRMKLKKQVMQSLRREAIHRLASGPCTHSQVHDSCHLVPQSGGLPQEVIESVLEDVAILRRASSNTLEPGKFVLKPECFAEYDPAFFHMSVQCHQQASEHRPALTRPTPVAPCPLEAHPMFQLFRVAMLKDETLMACVRACLTFQVEGQQDKRSETLLLRALHILTLAVHVLGGSSASPASQSKASSSGGAAAVVNVAGGDVKVGAAESAGAVRGLEASPRETFCSLMLERESGGCSRSIVQLLLCLKEDTTMQDKVVLYGIEWLLQRLMEMDERCRVAMPDANTEQLKDENDVESRKKAAREKVLAAMEQSRANFMANCMDTEDEDQDETLQAETSQVLPECIVCREVTGQPLGYVGFGQRSTVLDVGAGASIGTDAAVTAAAAAGAAAGGGGISGAASAMEGSRETSGDGASPFGRLANVEKKGGKDQGHVHMQFCGHALHCACYDQYFLTVVQRLDQQQHVSLDVVHGELYCPLCKAVSNLFVPHVPDHSNTYQSMDTSTEEDSSITSWVASGLQRAFDPGWVEESAVASYRSSGQRLMQRIYEISKGSATGTPDPIIAVRDAAASLAYSLASLAADGKPLAIIKGVADAQECLQLKHLKKVVKALRWASVDPGVRNELREGLVQMLQGKPRATATATATAHEAKGEREELSEASGSSLRIEEGEAVEHENVWTPLLSRNIFEVLVLVCLLIPPGNQKALMKAVQTLSLARMVQLALMMDTAQGQLMLAATQGPSHQDVVGMLETLEKDCTGNLLAFQQATLLLLEACVEESQEALTPPGQGLPATEDVAGLCRYFSLTTSFTEMLADEGTSSIVRAWIASASQLPMTLGYPNAVRNTLQRLPMAYTELHADLVARSSWEHPALCLICGKVLSARGTGQCTRHAATCGQGVGVMFLLQDCTILLLHGMRAAYFPSPYVDAYGT